MKRSGPLQRFVPLKRFTRLVVRTALRPFNPERRARLRERNYGDKADWIVMHPCCACGGQRGRPTVPAHYPYTKAARPGLRWMVPLCGACEDDFHRMGRHTFALHFEIRDDEALATSWHEVYEVAKLDGRLDQPFLTTPNEGGH